MSHSISRSYRLALVAFLAARVVCPAAGERPPLFQELLTSEGDDYLKARDQLLARGNGIRPFLNRVTKTSQDWREKAAATILLGWMDNSSLYTELSDWKMSPSLRRNPFPFYYREAHTRFSNPLAIPLILELVWKKDQFYYGALPALLAEAKVELAIPILVRKKTGFPREMKGFGPTATPYILEVLGGAERDRRIWLIQALGYTGGEKAVSELRRRLKTDDLVRSEAATALGELGEYAILRSEYFNLEQLDVRLKVLEALSKDHSDETRTLLTKVATTAPQAKGTEPYNAERLRAVQSMLEKPTEKDISAVCAIAPSEPHEYTRACFYLYLARPGVPLVREVLLKALQDPGLMVRVWAMEGLRFYNDDLVTLRVLETIAKCDEPPCRRAGIFMLKERVSPRIRKAALEWQKDKDPEIQGWAAEALAKNARSNAP